MGFWGGMVAGAGGGVADVAVERRVVRVRRMGLVKCILLVVVVVLGCCSCWVFWFCSMDCSLWSK